MGRKAKDFPLLEKVTILDAGSEGNAVARVGERVIFVPFAVPGDVVDIRVIRQRKSYFEGRVVHLHHASEMRTDPVCSHFGLCGGCRWQQMRYEDQLHFKQKQVVDNLSRIGSFRDFEILPILPSETTTFYRNKLEFTFSNRRWMTKEEMGMGSGEWERRNALGFHMPGMFDRVLDIRTCYLQGDPSNAVRLALKAYAGEKGLSFYDVRNRTGFLRNLIVRTTLTGEVMVILVVSGDDATGIHDILHHLITVFPYLTSVYYVVNKKHNDSLSDLAFSLYRGAAFITERMRAFREGDSDLVYRIGPTSFFQTNSHQAEALYRTAVSFADFRGDERVYDLYTGTGTIATYVARYVKQVTGIESVAAAIGDAEQNAAVNGIRNVRFVAGEVENILEPCFVEAYGKPDVIITDPPRSGMHERGIRAILDTGPDRIVYISCNPATQARDMALLNDHYRLIKCQPVDMFPHTQHVENVALLSRRSAPANA